jgi:hypothetical protein
LSIRIFAAVALLAGAVSCCGQQIDLPSAPAPQQLATVSADAQSQQAPANPPAADQKQNSTPVLTSPANSNVGVPRVDQQPTRILGIMPNYRAVSAGAIPPPPTPKEAFMVATRNSFDYSAFVFVGITSLLAEADNSHPQIGKGIPGFWGYTWRGYLDKTDGNYMVDFVFPSFLHEDERYYAKGAGNGTLWGRAVYSATRILITPNYSGHDTFNGAEILGRGVSQAISLAYYPSQSQTIGAFSQKYGYALGRDALTNVFREFWPDISEHAFHHHRKADAM